MANTLIAYFTWSGNSAHLAQRIQRITGGDLFHIRTQQPYPKSYPMTVSRAYKELQQHLWPELAAQVSRPEQYDQLYLVYPNWCGTMPMAVSAFLWENRFTGCTIHPLCTSGGSGMARSEADIEALYPDAHLRPGLLVSDQGRESTGNGGSHPEVGVGGLTGEGRHIQGKNFDFCEKRC